MKHLIKHDKMLLKRQEKPIRNREKPFITGFKLKKNAIEREVQNLNSIKPR